jgi:predicted nucleotide-binding protein (sugar kinase/HSP70/actin superfamily)
MADEDGYDGVIQLAPFTCTPEVVAQNVLPKLRRDVDIPVLTVILDEQTARTGLITRLEAFVDLLQRRRRTHRRRSKSWLARHLPLPNNPLSLSKGRG